MRHPSTRAERRFARFLAQLRYNKQLQSYWTYRTGRYGSAETNLLWNHGGKRCEAHGNRCAHSLSERYERRQLVKALRSRIEPENRAA